MNYFVHDFFNIFFTNLVFETIAKKNSNLTWYRHIQCIWKDCDRQHFLSDLTLYFYQKYRQNCLFFIVKLSRDQHVAMHNKSKFISMTSKSVLDYAKSPNRAINRKIIDISGIATFKLDKESYYKLNIRYPKRTISNIDKIIDSIEINLQKNIKETT